MIFFANLIYYRFNESYPSFIIDPVSGSVYLKKPLDRENYIKTKGSITLKVSCTDGKYVDSSDIIVTIEDVNDKNAVFKSESNQFNISEELVFIII